MKHRNFLVLATACLFHIYGCAPRNVTTTATRSDEAISVHGKLFATIFQQQAAEYRALCFQAFNIARYRLEQLPAATGKPRAIVTDIDETILDNSPYQAMRVLQGKDYEAESWYQWTEKASADTLPGAGSFLKFAASRNLEIFYVTNRGTREKASTIRNLAKFNLPNADAAHVIVRQDTSSKELRRSNIRQTHEIVMLLGDNLADLSNVFDKRPLQGRREATDAVSAEFANRFILLPNTVYGDWESSLYNFKRLTEAQKDSVLRVSLKGY